VFESPAVAKAGPAWRDALDALERQVDASPEGCHGIELRVTLARGGVRVSARAPDGAEASRIVTSPAALPAVAFGLLASAPAEEPPPSEDSPFDVPPPSEEPPRPVPPPPPSPFDTLPRIEVSASFGARAGFPTNVIMGDLEGRADVFVHEWLVTLNLRGALFSRSSRLADDLDAYQEAALGLGVGRELRIGRSAFALTAGPDVTYVWMESDALNLSTGHAQLRLAGVARYAYTVSSRVRLNGLLDMELAPTDLVHDDDPTSLAPFPIFTVGVRLGVEVAL
jgi:hypothetical protein